MRVSKLQLRSPNRTVERSSVRRSRVIGHSHTMMTSAIAA